MDNEDVMAREEKKVEEMMMAKGKKQPKVKKTGAKFDSANHELDKQGK